ncbi:GspH family T2SS minor pseudopilin variant LspH [Methylosoma difficile]
MKGFTLLEVMIVVVLIGIISSMSLLAMGSGEQSQWQQQEAERLLELFKLTSQEATVRGSPLAVELCKDGYRFLQFQDEQWQPELHDSLFRQRSLPAKLQLALRINNKPIRLDTLAQTGFNNQQPQIVFTPDGSISPFQIHIALEGESQLFSLANTAKDGLLIQSPDSRHEK